MALVFRCSQCGKTHTKEAEWAGKVINCDGCWKGMRIPAPRVAASRGADADRGRPLAATSLASPVIYRGENGFAVLAYELDGMVPDPKPTDDAAYARYIRSFVDAEAGLVNLRVAVEFATTRVPSIDPERLNAAGHSSAATLALLVAENEPRIAACVAYAPVVDLRAVIPADAHQVVARLVPCAGDLFTRFNPRVGESNLDCPLFLFVALDDDYAQQDRDFVQRLRSMGKNVTLGTVPSGGHHEPMIRNGIPAAIRWLKSLQPGEDGTLVPTKPAPTARPKTNLRRAPGKAVMPPSPGARRPRANPGPG